MIDKYENRRLRTLELRKWLCDDSSARLAERIARPDNYVARMLAARENTTQPKRIGESMRDVIEAAFHLPQGWLDLPVHTPLPSGPAALPIHQATEPQAPAYQVAPKPAGAWPFKLVTAQRLAELVQRLGHKRALEALRDIDELLDVAVSRWEARAASTRQTA